jgi:hypothetical protein
MPQNRTTPQVRTEVERKTDSEISFWALVRNVSVVLVWLFGSSAYRVTLVNTDDSTRSRMEARIAHENGLAWWCEHVWTFYCLESVLVSWCTGLYSLLDGVAA